jgi:hypothetical protein
VWGQQRQKLIDANSTQKPFSDPKHGNFQELEKETAESVHLKRKNWSAN